MSFRHSRSRVKTWNRVAGGRRHFGHKHFRKGRR